jgi:RHS repeat-associated protein
MAAPRRKMAARAILTSDHLGSTRVVTNSEEAVVARHDYLPFGEEIMLLAGGRTKPLGYTDTDDTRQKFTSKERDLESNLDFFEARYFSAPQGRFTSPDEEKGSGLRVAATGISAVSEIGPLPYADIQNPQSVNKYAYTINNPLKYIDPDGHDYRILDGKDKRGRKTKSFIWDRDYIYKKGDKNGVASDFRYIDTQGRAIQLWGDSTKSAGEKDHGYQVIEPSLQGEKLVGQADAAPSSFVSYGDTRAALIANGFQKFWDPHPAHWGGTDFADQNAPLTHADIHNDAHNPIEHPFVHIWRDTLGVP